MGRFAARLVTWGIGCSLTALVVAIAVLLWFEQSAQADGAGVGLGLLVTLVVALTLLLVPVLLGTLMLARLQQGGHAGLHQQPALLAGVAYSLLALVVASVIALQ